jgi:LPXTG-site transpeptidase (sortase) family protein
MKLLVKVLIILGIVCYALGIFLIWERNNPGNPAISYEENYKDFDLSNPPVRITIKNVGIDLPIYPAKTNNGKLETTTKGASYIESTPLPGEVGNSIIYAHDWVSLFGPLVEVHPGDTIEVEYADKTKKDFIVQSTRVVPYSMSGILSPTKDRRITLYTCTGFFDSKRFVVVALLS